MTFKFIHAADIHLDSPLKGLERYEGAPVEEIRGATRKALENLVKLAIEEEVAFVVIAGDIYDGDWNDFNTGLFFANQMLRLKAVGIPVVAIRGNHDAQNKMTRSLTLPDNVRMLSAKKSETLKSVDLGINGISVAFHGQSFASAAVLENIVLDYPAADPHCFNLGILHTSLTGNEGHDTYAPCTVQDLKSKGYDYWALGHIHQRNNGQYNDPPIVFSGNIQGRHIREQGAKGCVLVTVDDNYQPSLEFCPLDVIRWVECPVDVSGAADGEEVVERFKAKLRESLREHADMPLAVRVVLSGPCPAHEQLIADLERWKNEIRLAATDASGGTAWVEKILLQTSLPRLLDDMALSDGPLAEILQTLADLRANDSALAGLAEELDDLRRKLPEELNKEPDWRRLDVPARLAEYLDEVEALLISRLAVPEEVA